MVVAGVIVLIVLILHGLPLFAGMGALSALLYFGSDGFESLIGAFIDPYSRLTQNDLLLPIPLFTVMGYLIAKSGMPERIVRVFGRMMSKGAGKAAFTFGILTILVSALFTPFTGASGVTIIALGGILFPVLVQAGYNERLSTGIITSSGSLGLLFFPSIPVILFGIVSNNKAPIPDLFVAGILPGLLLILLPSLYVIFKTRKMKVVPAADWGESKNDGIKLVLEVLFVPVVFFLFINGKIAISEIGLVGLLYFLILEVLVFKEIKIKQLPEIAESAFSMVGGILVIIFFATAFTGFLIDQQVPQAMFEWISGFIESKWTFLILLNIFLLVVGALMDIFSAIIVTAPLVIPVAEMFGINMVHLGILYLTNLEIGYITPPVGINLFLSSFRFKKTMTEIYSSIWPFMLILLFAQILITYIPEISLVLLGE